MKASSYFAFNREDPKVIHRLVQHYREDHMILPTTGTICIKHGYYHNKASSAIFFIVPNSLETSPDIPVNIIKMDAGEGWRHHHYLFILLK